MRRVALADLPLDLRADVARNLINNGEDPYMMLAATVWPKHVAFYVDQPTQSEGFCKNGHPWDEANTAYRRGKLWKRCRACERDSKATRERAKWSRRKVPCVFCGEPASPPSAQGARGSGIARCKDCYNDQRYEGCGRR